MAVVEDRGRGDAHFIERIAQNAVHRGALGAQTDDLAVQVGELGRTGGLEGVNRQVRRIERDHAANLVHRAAGPIGFALDGFGNRGGHADADFRLAVLNEGEVRGGAAGFFRRHDEEIRERVVQHGGNAAADEVEVAAGGAGAYRVTERFLRGRNLFGLTERGHGERHGQRHDQSKHFFHDHLSCFFFCNNNRVWDHQTVTDSGIRNTLTARNARPARMPPPITCPPAVAQLAWI